MPRSGWSLAFRLTAWYTAASLLLLLAATGTLYWALVANLERDSSLFLADKVHVLTTLLLERPDDWDGLKEEIELESAARRYDQFYIRLLNEHSKTLLETSRMGALLPAKQFGELSGKVERLESASGLLYLATQASAPVGGRKINWTIQIAVSLGEQQEVLRRYRMWVWAILLASTIACPLVGYQIAGRGIRPVRYVAETAKRIGSSTLSERIQADGYPVELEDLARTFNAMLDRLEESFERLTRFSADLAHELRTPVNNIRGEMEVALARARTVDEYREVLHSNLEEAVRLSELIGSLLFLARTENPGTHIKRETVEFGELLHSISEYYEAAAEQAGVTLAVSATQAGLTLKADRSLLQRAVGNLVSNALAHTARGGQVELSAGWVNDALEISVEDNGCGIPAESIPHLFDRFYRVDQARPHSGGFGLGLSIVRGIMLLHGGSVQVSSQQGSGTKVTLFMTKM